MMMMMMMMMTSLWLAFLDSVTARESSRTRLRTARPRITGNKPEAPK